MLLQGVIYSSLFVTYVTAIFQGKQFKCDDCDWFLFNGGCYKYPNETATWQKAGEKCIGWGGHLVSILSSEENEKAQALGMCEDQFWIGLKKDEAWKWSDDNTFSYNSCHANFGDTIHTGIEGDLRVLHNPNEKCAYHTEEGWKSDDCDKKRKFICKKPAIETPRISSCHIGWTEYEDHCYMIPNDKADHGSAYKKCLLDLGGRLVQMESEKEQRIVQWLQECSNDVWTGLNITDSISHEANTSLIWKDDQKCVANDGGLYIAPCDQEKKYICKKKPQSLYALL